MAGRDGPIRGVSQSVGGTDRNHRSYLGSRLSGCERDGPPDGLVGTAQERCHAIPRRNQKQQKSADPQGCREEGGPGRASGGDQGRPEPGPWTLTSKLAGVYGPWLRFTVKSLGRESGNETPRRRRLEKNWENRDAWKTAGAALSAQSLSRAEPLHSRPERPGTYGPFRAGGSGSDPTRIRSHPVRHVAQGGSGAGRGGGADRGHVMRRSRAPIPPPRPRLSSESKAPLGQANTQPDSSRPPDQRGDAAKFTDMKTWQRRKKKKKSPRGRGRQLCQVGRNPGGGLEAGTAVRWPQKGLDVVRLSASVRL